MSNSPDRRIAAVAARQHSVFTRTQALKCGFTPTMIHGRIELGLWIPRHRGVYVLAGRRNGPKTPAMAACLATEAVAARCTAAVLWGMPVRSPDTVEVLVPHGKRRVREGITTLQATTLLPGDLGKLDAVPITAPARTLIDLAAVLNPDELESAADDALARQLTTLSRLERRLERQSLAGHRGTGVLRAIVAGYHPATAASKSHLAQRFVRLFRRLGLPEPVPELPVRLLDGRVIHVDLGYSEFRLAIEIESQRWHTGRRKTEQDLARENELELAGYRLLHLTDADRRRPDYLRRIVLGAIGLAA